MPSQADKIHSFLIQAMENKLQQVADDVTVNLKKNTPKRTGKTAASWTQIKQENGDIHIVTRLPDGQPARYLKELNSGNAQQAPTRFIEKSIAEALDKARGG